MCFEHFKCVLQHTYLLPNLHYSLPEVLGFHAMAVVTHLGLNDKLDHKHLLQDSTVHHLERQTQQVTPYPLTECQTIVKTLPLHSFHHSLLQKRDMFICSLICAIWICLTSGLQRQFYTDTPTAQIKELALSNIELRFLLKVKEMRWQPLATLTCFKHT